MNNKKLVPSLIAVGALLVACVSAYLFFTGKQEKTLSLLTIVSCTMVAVGQYYIIKSKK